jgi:hypothetical protein
MRSRCMSLLPRTTLHSDSEQLYPLFTTVFPAGQGHQHHSYLDVVGCVVHTGVVVEEQILALGVSVVALACL